MKADHALDCRLRARAADDGFVLLETIIAIGLISVIMAAFTTFFVNAVASTGQQRANQTGTVVANSAVETIRGLPASDLVNGHDTGSVTMQFGKASPLVKTWLTSMEPAIDSGALAGDGLNATVSTSPTIQSVKNCNDPVDPTCKPTVYSVDIYLGWCGIPTDGSSVDCTVAAKDSGTKYLRAVIAVTWPMSQCVASVCTYLTSTLLSTEDDPTFNLNQSAPAVPEIIPPGNQKSTVGNAEVLQLSIKAGTGVPELSWRITVGTLPAGLALTAAGLISGRPTTVTTGGPSVTVTVTDGFGRTAEETFAWAIVPKPTLVAPAAQTSSIGGTVSLQPNPTNTCPNSPCTYALVNGPGGLSINNSGVISGTVAGTAQIFSAVTVTVTDNDGASVSSAPFSWTVTSTPSVAAPPAQTSTVGSTVSLPVASTCPLSPCTYLLSNAPATLAISASGVITGTITSTPQAFAAATVTIRDRSGTTATSAQFIWTVVAKPTVTSPGAQTTTTGATISLPLATTCPNAPCSYVVNGGPATLAVSAAGVITGTITSVPQTFAAVSVTVTDNAGMTTSSTSFSWVVKIKPTVTAPANQSGSVGGSVNLALTSTCANSPCSYVLNNGPGGLNISSSGVVSGTITGGAQAYSPTVTITDAAGVSATSTAFTWTVVALPSVTAPSDQMTTTGSLFSLTLAYSCPNSPCTFALNNGPATLAISASGVITGTITSTPQTFAASSITIRDRAGTAVTSTPFKWTVATRPSVTSPGTQITTTGAVVSLGLATSCANSPCTYALNLGPATLAIDANGVVNGTITSTPQTFAASSVTVTDNSGTTATSATFSWTVQAKPSVGSPGNQTTAQGGTVSLNLASKSCPNWPCSYVLNNGPAGLSINANGLISGTVTSTPQVFTSTTITITDAVGVSATSAAFTWTVTYAALVPTNPGTQKNTIGTPIDPLQMTATGGSGNYTWSTVSGLPAGLTMTAGGLITGTPTTPASNTTVLKVSDSAAGTNANVSFAWTVVARPTIGAPGNLTATAGQQRSVTLPYTCPYSSCVITLAGGVPGLGLSTNSANTANTTTTTLNVASTTGTVYINGTIQSSAVPTGNSQAYTPSVTITDGADATATPAAGAWTIYAAPTLGAPYANLSATVGTVKVVPMSYTCPYPSCTITLTGTVPGLGLSTNSANTANTTTTTLIVTGTGTVYINGTIQASAVPTGTSAIYTIGVTIRDAGGAGPIIPTAGGTWTIYKAPTLGTPGTLTATETSSESVPLPFTCPFTSCTVTLNNSVPGIGLSTTAGNSTNNTTTSLIVNSTTGTVYLNGTVQMTAVTSGTSKVYNPLVKITDAGGLIITPAAGTWTIYTPPTITPPGNQAVEPNQSVTLQIAASCPNGGCTYAAAAQVNGTPDWNPIPISATGLISYPSAPQGAYTIRVIVTDQEQVTAVTYFGLIVQNFSLYIQNQNTARPSSGTVGNPLNLDVGMSPTADGYIYTATSVLPSWLTLADGVLTPRVTSTTTRGNYSISILVRSAASSASTATYTFTWTIS